MAQTQVKTPNAVRGSNVVSNIAASGNTDLLELDVRDIDVLAVEIVLSADHAFDAFLVQAKIHPDSSYVTITSAVTSTPGGIVLAASGTLATLAAGATGWALLDVRAFSFVKFLASADVDGTDATVRAKGRRGNI